jgi:TetR/AcrR family transcriptional regulator, fatty acid metabolism regulator protein
MRKKEGNKEQAIINAAIRVFAEDGYFHSKIHRIADIAGVATGTVYLYFGNKETILQKIFSIVWEDIFGIIDKIHAATDITPLEKFHKMIDGLFDYLTANPSLALVFVNEQSHLEQQGEHPFTNYYDKTLTLSEALLTDGIRAYIFDEHIHPPVFSAFFFGGLRFILRRWANDPKRFSLSEIRTDVKQFVLYGINRSHAHIKSLYNENSNHA